MAELVESEDKHLLNASSYNVDLQSGHLTPPGTKTDDNSDLYYGGNDTDQSSATVEDISGTKRLRKFVLVEPAFCLYLLGLFSIIPLKNQFVYAHLLRDAIDVISASSPIYNSTLPNITDRLGHGKPVYEDNLPPGFLNYTADTHAHGLDHSAFWDRVKQSSSLVVLFLDIVKGVPSIFTNPIICAYTDVVGRRLGLILPCVGLILELTVYLTVLYINAPITYLGLGYLFEGLCGSHPVLFGTAYAYIADVTHQSSRTFRFVTLNALFLLCYTLATLAVGFVIDNVGYAAALWMTVVPILLSLTYSVFFLQETVSNPSATFSVKKIYQSTKAAFNIYAIKRKNEGQIRLIILLSCMFLQASMLIGMGDLYVIYLVGPPFYFSSVMIGVFLAEYAFANAIGPMLAIGVFRKHVGDIYIAMLGCVLSAIGFIIFAFIPEGNGIFCGMCLRVNCEI